jgi:hypothetical protein
VYAIVEWLQTGPFGRRREIHLPVVCGEIGAAGHDCRGRCGAAPMSRRNNTCFCDETSRARRLSERACSTQPDAILR